MKAELKTIPLEQRSTIRAASRALSVPRSTISRILREGNIVCRSNSVLPSLTEQNKYERLLYCFERVREDDTGTLNYASCYDEVHIDEKWFYMMRPVTKAYLAEGEVAPKRKCQHKGHIIKVMFLAAVARPRFDRNGSCLFDGKIGMWPFVEEQSAQKTSNYCPAGTLELKPVSVDSQRYKEYILEQVMPAIKRVWSQKRWTEAFVSIQHNNAPVHFNQNDNQWIEYAHESANNGRWTFNIRPQPPNSPDLNILDLGFFRSIQALQYEQCPAKTIPQLIRNVQQAWIEYNPNTLNRIWLSHGYGMNEIVGNDGNNEYTLPHVGKEQLEREGRLPTVVPLDFDALDALEDYEMYDILENAVDSEEDSDSD